MSKKNSEQVVKYQNPFDSFPDRGLFFLAFVTGVVGIIGLKFFGVPQLLVTAWPALIMITYGVLVWRTRQFQLREDQIGDNLYYLGFLYTLTSLSCALFQFQVTTSSTIGANEATSGVDAIISNFGIALITTILGLALRVMFNQMRQDPVEIEHVARLDLAEASRKLRTELYDIVLNLNDFRRATYQSIGEALDETKARTDASLTETIGRFGDTANLISTRIEEAFNRFSSHAEQLNTISSGVVANLQALFVRIEQIETPSDLIANRLTPAIEAMRETAYEIREQAKTDDKALKRTQKAMETALAATDQLGVHVVTLSGQAEHANVAFTAIARTAEQLKAIGDACEHVISKLTEERAVQNQVIEGIREASILPMKEMKIFLENISKETAGFGEIQTEIAGVVKVLRTHNVELQQELSSARNATTKVHASLVEMTNALTDKLNEESSLQENQKRIANL